MLSFAAIVEDYLQLMEIRKESIVPIDATLSIDTAKKKAEKNKSEKIHF